MGIKLEDKKDIIKLDRFKVIVQVCAGEQVRSFLIKLYWQYTWQFVRKIPLKWLHRVTKAFKSGRGAFGIVPSTGSPPRCTRTRISASLQLLSGSTTNKSTSFNPFTLVIFLRSSAINVYFFKSRKSFISDREIWTRVMGLNKRVPHHRHRRPRNRNTQDRNRKRLSQWKSTQRSSFLSFGLIFFAETCRNFSPKPYNF